MRAEFFRGERPDEILGSARWAGRVVGLESPGGAFAETLQRVFRPTPVVVDDPSLRPAGTSGPVVLVPGSLRWFQAVAALRGAAEGVGVRLVPEAGGALGFDPAGTYRPFAEQLDRRERVSGPGLDVPE